MFILNQIVGIGDFNIMDNFRLIVVAAIFIGIVVVLLYRKSAKRGRKTRRKQPQPQTTNPYDSGSKEEQLSADVVDHFMSIGEELKAEKAEDFDDISESEAESEIELEEVSVVNPDKTVVDIESMEGEVNAKLEAGIKNIRAEFATVIEGLISKIEESEKEVVNKVENVVDTRIQEVLSEINDRIDEVLQAQKNSTDLVLEKIINSLRQQEETVFTKIPEAIDDSDVASETLDTFPIEETPVDISLSQESAVVVEKTIKKKAATKKRTTPRGKQVVKKEPSVKKKPVAKKTLVSRKKPEAVEDKNIPSETLDTSPIEEKPVGIKSSKKSRQSQKVVDKKAEFEEITESVFGFSDEESDILGKLANSLQMGGASAGISFPAESGDIEEIAEVPEKTEKTEKTEEKDGEILSETKEDITVEEEGQIASSKKIEKNGSGAAAVGLDDLDILDFLKEDSIDVSLPDEADANEEIGGLSEGTQEEFIGKAPEVSEGEKVEVAAEVTSPAAKEKNLSGVDEVGTADFDIQEFLEELGDLPSEKD